MTPIDSTHEALLRGIAKNTNDETARKVYADWLQEQGNPGWLIVLCYKPTEWYVRCDDNGQTTDAGPNVKFPWLTGWMQRPRKPTGFRYSAAVTNPKQRLKLMLEAYASGIVRSTPFEENTDGE